jgi:AraC-like DNA-binding protein
VASISEPQRGRASPSERLPPPTGAIAPVLRRFATDHLPSDQQFAAWCDHYGALVETSRPPLAARGARAAAPVGFRAHQTVWETGGLALSRARAPAVRFARQGTSLRRSPLDLWALVHTPAGRTTLRAGDRVAEVGPGATYVWSLGHPIEGVRSGQDWLVLFLPRSWFQGLAPLLDAAHGSVLPCASGLLVGDLVRSIAARLTLVTDQDTGGIAEALRALLRVCLAPETHRDAIPEAATEALDRARRRRVERIVEASLHDPGLAPGRLAGLCGLSRSTLYRLFAPDGGVATHLRRRRLALAREALADPADRRPIHVIAEDLAFGDPATFARAFRAEHGCSPRDVRVAALAAAGGDAASTRETRCASRGGDQAVSSGPGDCGHGTTTAMARGAKR